jgi:cellulase/cellobiase CelA1
MRASNPGMKVLVARIIPMNASNCAACGQRVVDLNAAIPGWAASKSTTRSPVTVVDQWTGFSTAADTYDGVHPNASGDQKIADRWFQPLSAAISGTTPPDDPPPAGSCVAEIRVVNRWQGAFQIELVVRNGSGGAMSGWTVRFTLGAGMAVQQAWNATVATQGTNVTVGNMSWNGSLAPGSSATVGMTISGDPTGWTPNPTC